MIETRASKSTRWTCLISNVVVCLIGLILTACQIICPTSANSQEGRALVPSRDELVEGVCAAYHELGKLPGIEVEYRIDHKAMAVNSSQLWAWDWGEFYNAIRPADKSKSYVRVRFPLSTKEPGLQGSTVERVYSLDGALRVDLESRDKKASDKAASDKAASAIISTTVNHPTTTFQSMFCYYFRFMGFPVTASPEMGFAPRKVYPRGTYWLPEALTNSRELYQVRETQEFIDGVWCHVLERPGVDVLWVEVGKPFILRRRKFWWGKDQIVRHDIAFRDLKEVVPGKLWLPHTIVYDDYAAPWDNAILHGKVACRYHLTVSRLNVRILPDSRFRAEIPLGAVVIDCIHTNNPKRGFEFINRPGVDPFEYAVSVQAKKFSRKNYFRLIISGVLACILLILIFFRLWRRRRAKTAE